MRRCVLTVVAVLLAAPVLGQSADFQAVLAGKDNPTTLKLSQLDDAWQRVVIRTSDGQKGGLGDMMSQLMQIGMASEMGKSKGKPSDTMGAMLGMSMLGGLFGGGSEEPVYYTQGKAVTVAGETFLVAYALDKKAPDMMALMAESEKNGKEPDMAALAASSKVTGDSTLALTLVNVRSIGSMSGIRPFKLETEIAEGSKGSNLLNLISSQSEPKEGPTSPAPVKPTHAKKK